MTALVWWPWCSKGSTKKGAPGPLLGTIWWVSTIAIVVIVYLASHNRCAARLQSYYAIPSYLR